MIRQSWTASSEGDGFHMHLKDLILHVTAMAAASTIGCLAAGEHADPYRMPWSIHRRSVQEMF